MTAAGRRMAFGACRMTKGTGGASMVAQTKMWTKPEFIVLVRGKPDEAVLAYCKENGLSGSQGNSAAGCIQPTPIVCQVCQLSNTS